jgi:hypothetical protein
MLLIAKINQGVEIIRSQKNDVPPAASIAAIWATKLYELFSPKADTPSTTITTFKKNFCLIEKFHPKSISVRKVVLLFSCKIFIFARHPLFLIQKKWSSGGRYRI